MTVTVRTVELRAVRRVLDSYVLGYSLYQVCEPEVQPQLQRSASEIRRAPVQIGGLTGTVTVSTKAHWQPHSPASEKGF